MLQKIKSGEIKIALIGLGYVGLPLAVEFGKKFDTVGFDIKPDRLQALRNGTDETLETSSEDLKSATLSNASTEGFNNKIRWLMRQAYGFRDYFFLKLKIFQLPSLRTQKEL